MKRTHPYDAVADAEIAKHPTAQIVRRETNGQGCVLWLRVGDATRPVFYPKTPSDRKGPLNHVRDIRRVLRALGA